MHAFFDHAGSLGTVLGLVAALLLVSGGVRALQPARMAAVRRAWSLFGLYVALAALAGIWMDRPVAWVDAGVDLLQAWCLVALASVLVFHLVLPSLRVRVVDLTSDLVTGAAYLLVTVPVLGAAGLDLTGLVAASTVAGVFLTISLQGTLGNVIGGLALQLERSVQEGDWVRLDSGLEGRVMRLRWRHTTLLTRDGDTAVVPNSALLSGTFLLLGQRDGLRGSHRQTLHFAVPFEHPPARVTRLIEDALRDLDLPNVAASPAPQCVCLELVRDPRASAAAYAVRYWLTDLAEDGPTDSAVRARIHATLRRSGIPLARPSAVLFQVEESPEEAQARAERRETRAMETLRAVTLFASLTESELDHLADHLVYCPFEAGEVMTRQGAVAHYLYLMHSGTAEVRTEVDGAPPKLVTRLDAPAFFGEMGLMTGEPRRASVVATSPVTCFRLDKAAFEQVLQARPELADQLSKLLAHRRVELDAVREDLDEAAMRRREVTEQVRILGRIRNFFGIG